MYDYAWYLFLAMTTILYICLAPNCFMDCDRAVNLADCQSPRWLRGAPRAAVLLLALLSLPGTAIFFLLCGLYCYGCRLLAAIGAE